MTTTRTLTDADMDRIDHALGRPANPMRETSRNFYTTDAGTALCEEMTASPFWYRLGAVNRSLAVFEVTDAGREALASYLDEGRPKG